MQCREGEPQIALGMTKKESESDHKELFFLHVENRECTLSCHLEKEGFKRIL